MGKLCLGCPHNEVCETICPPLIELRRIKRELHKKETREIIQDLRKLLNTRDAETADDLKELAESVIDEHPNELGFIRDMEIEVGYVRSYQRKTKDGCIVYADTEKTKHRYTAFLPFDFVITFYEPNVAMFNDEQKRILMWHELKHIGIGEKGFRVMPHDIEDFFSIIEKHGLRWADSSNNDDWI